MSRTVSVPAWAWCVCGLACVASVVACGGQAQSQDSSVAVGGSNESNADGSTSESTAGGAPNESAAAGACQKNFCAAPIPAPACGGTQRVAIYVVPSWEEQPCGWNCMFKQVVTDCPTGTQCFIPPGGTQYESACYEPCSTPPTTCPEPTIELRVSTPEGVDLPAALDATITQLEFSEPITRPLSCVASVEGFRCSGPAGSSNSGSNRVALSAVGFQPTEATIMVWRRRDGCGCPALKADPSQLSLTPL